MRRLLWSLVFGIAGSLPQVASAALQVTPLSLTLSEVQRVGVFTIRNDDSAPVTVQTKVSAWSYSDGLERRLPSEAALIVPPIFTVPAFGQQVVRFGFRQFSSNALEQSYRVVFSQLPTSSSVAAGVAITFAFDIPVFVEPTGRRFNDVTFSVRGSGRSAQLRAQNLGSIHKQFRTLRLVNASGTTLATINGAGYVLAGGTQQWTVEIPAGTKPVAVTYDALDGSARSSLSPSP